MLIDCQSIPESNNNLELLIISLTLLVSFAAVCLAIYAARIQRISIILLQLSEKAKEANSYLDDYSRISLKEYTISGIVSTLITARQLLRYNFYRIKNEKRNGRKFILMRLNEQYFIDQFYLQLHTTIREWINKDELNSSEKASLSEGNKNLILNQYRQVKDFFKDSTLNESNQYYDQF